MKIKEKEIVRIVTVDTIVDVANAFAGPFIRERTLSHAENKEIAQVIIDEDKKKDHPDYITKREYRLEKSWIWEKSE